MGWCCQLMTRKAEEIKVSACGTSRARSCVAMNVSLATMRNAAPPVSLPIPMEDESAHIRRLWSLLSLFSLYAAALFVVILVSDGPDIGCILMGIAGHVFYASGRTVMAWREASWMDDARARMRDRRFAHRMARA
jgi:hypothetical protein